MDTETETRRIPGSASDLLVPALLFAALAAAYGALSFWFFWVDWFRFLGPDRPVFFHAAGLVVPVTHCLATFLSPWRLVLAPATVAILLLASWRLARGASEARALGLFALWGLLLPQVCWYTELSFDWFGGAAIPTILALAAMVVASGTWLLSRDDQTLAGWGELEAGRGRLLAAMIGLGWLLFGATALMDHAYQWPDHPGFVAAGLSVPLLGLALTGLFRQRAWALPAAAAGVLLLATVPFSLSGAFYLPDGRAMDILASSVSEDALHTFVAAVLPGAVLVWLLSPLLRAAARVVRGQ